MIRARRCMIAWCLLASGAASPAAILRVMADAAGPVHDGAAWDTAFLKVQDAVNAAQPGDEVWVSAGAYLENIRIPQSTPVSLYGGFAGTESARAERALGRTATVLDGARKATVITIRAANVTIDGFTITHGGGGPLALIDPEALELQGSGVVCAADGAVIAHNLITANASSGGMYYDAGPTSYYIGSGGGIACFGNAATLADNVISGNSSGGWYAFGVGPYPMSGKGAWGAGVLVYGQDAVLRGNTITGNSLYSTSSEPVGSGQDFRSLSLGGAGVACLGARASLERNVITHNAVTAIEYSVDSRYQVYPSGSGAGAGVAVYAPGVRLTGNLVAHNSVTANSSSVGGGISAGSAALVNNTIVDNQAVYPSGGPASGGGVYASDAGTLTNNLIAFNTGSLTLQGAVTLSHNDVYPAAYDPPAAPHPTDLAADPLFAARATGNYHLQPGSPCVDAGDDAAAPAGGRDLDGRPRILGPHVDIGAYETPPAAGVADAIRALAIAAGLSILQPGEVSRLDVAGGSSAGVVDLQDALALMRRANGLAP